MTEKPDLTTLSGEDLLELARQVQADVLVAKADVEDGAPFERVLLPLAARSEVWAELLRRIKAGIADETADMDEGLRRLLDDE